MKTKDRTGKDQPNGSQSSLSSRVRTRALSLLAASKRHRREVAYNAAIAAGILLLVTTVGIYGFGWENRLSKNVSYLVPYQAASVDGQAISYKHFMRTLDQLLINTGTGSAPKERHEMSLQAINILVNDALIDRAATEHGVEVTEEEVDTAYGAALARRPDQDGGADKGSFDYGAYRGQVKASLVAYKLERSLLDSAEIGDNQTLLDWISQQREEADISYLLPQHSQRVLR